MFQSTHPYRVRLFASSKDKQNLMFQSTHPYRVRPDAVQDEQGYWSVSIHAPIQGATQV